LALTGIKKPANRDIFDTWFILGKKWDVNWRIIKEISGLDKKILN